jgi:uncharacterized protein involved in exopolysaccharide biosynthesis
MSAPPRERTETHGAETHGATPAWWAEERAFRPVSLFYAVRRYWLAVALPVVLFGALGVAYGQHREPTYTAQARLIVGGLQLNTSGAQAGFATAVQGLAEAYSRAVTADAVVEPLARRFNTTQDGVRGALNGTPLPNSPIFTITAANSTERGAVELANATTRLLLRYLQDLYGNNPAAKRLSRAYRRAAQTASDKDALATQRRKTYQDNPSRTNRTAFARARSQADSAALDRDAIGDQYRAASGSNVGSSTIVQVLTNARVASSDRKASMQKFGVIGAVLGLLIGLAVALALANRLARRVRGLA